MTEGQTYSDAWVLDKGEGTPEESVDKRKGVG